MRKGVPDLRPSNRMVQGLWIGSSLSTMERLSIASFLRQGHRYRLYTYREVANLPRGVEVSDANAILPESMIFRYADSGSVAGFANFFRYKLLLERGGWWADTDFVCLRPWDFDQEYVFASEPCEGGGMATNAAIKAPAHSELMAYLWQVCLGKQPEKLAWGETGPLLMEEALRRFSLESHLLPSKAFCPHPPAQWKRVLDPLANWVFDRENFAIHLWHELWRRNAQDKDASYPPDCLYEKLKRNFLPETFRRLNAAGLGRRR